MSARPAWLEREQTARTRQQTRFRQQFQVGRTFTYEPRDLPGPTPDDPRVPAPHSGETVTVLRAPRLDVTNASVRVQLPDGTQLTVRPGTLKRFQTDPFTRTPIPPEEAQPPGRAGQPLEYPDAPPEPTSPQALHRISQDARSEINRLAQAIHRRHFVMPPRPERETGTPSQPRSNADAGLIQEHWLGSYSDAMLACKAISGGRWEEAGHYAQQALKKQADYRQASRRLEQTSVRTSSGRYFHAELLSIRHYHPCTDPRLKAAFEQWYVRLVLIWAEDGVTLTVANAAQLEGESGIQVGPDGWNDLVRWISDQTEVQDGKRRGRRLDDDRDLIYLWREDRGAFELRRKLYHKYPGLPRAFEALRRAMHQLRTLDEGELPDDRPAIGYHPPEPREDDSIGDDELQVLEDA